MELSFKLNGLEKFLLYAGSLGAAFTVSAIRGNHFGNGQPAPPELDALLYASPVAIGGLAAATFEYHGGFLSLGKTNERVLWGAGHTLLYGLTEVAGWSFGYMLSKS